MLAVAQPQLDSMGRITSKCFLLGSNDEQECPTPGQQMDRADTESTPDSPLRWYPGTEGRGPELTDGPVLRQGDTFPILTRAQGYTEAAVGVQ